MAKQTHVVHSDQPVKLTIEPASSGSDPSWFRLFRSVVHSGAWARLTPSAAKVLVVLAECVNDAMRKESGVWIAWPSIATIAARAGIERRAAQKAVGTLEEAGLVRRCRRRNSARGDYSNEYELIAPDMPRASAKTQGVLQMGAQGGAHADAHGPAPTRARAQRTSNRSPSAVARAQQSTDQKEIDLNNNDAAAALKEVGIKEPALSRIMNSHPHDELFLRLRDWQTRNRLGTKLGVAWLIASIQQKYDLHEKTLAQIEQEERRVRAQSHRLQVELAQQEEEKRQIAIDQQCNALFDEMSDAEQEHWKQQVIAEIPGLIRNADELPPAHPKIKPLILGKLVHLLGESVR
jgi:Helix-turn-helix domain